MAELRTLPLDRLDVDPVNPRVHVDPADVDELAASIGQRGVDQPLQVRPALGGRYGVLSGQQRLQACQKAGLDEVPCLVHDRMDDRTATVLAITSNVGSKPMRPSDEARAYRSLVRDGMTQAEVAETCGVSEPRVSDLLKLLDLPDDIIAKVDAGQVGLRRAVDVMRKRYENGRGKARGKAAARARDFGAIGSAHLTAKAAGALLGVRPVDINRMVRDGVLVRDDVSGGIPLHEVARALEEDRRQHVAVGGVTVAVERVLPPPVHARLQLLAERVGHPTGQLVVAAVEDLLRRSKA